MIQGIRCARAKRWFPALFALLLSVGFGLIFLSSNSPLFRTYGSDSAIFLTIGRAVAQGKVPYIDVFDHKGPVIFWINALSQAIAVGTQSAWMLEILFLWASLLVIHQIARCLHVYQDWPLQLLYIALMAVWIDGGNYTEEYCNLFTLLAFWFSLRFACGQEERSLWAFGLGAMFALCAMVRLNNAIATGALTLTMAAALCGERKGKHLVRHALSWMAGVGVVLLPCVVYFAVHGALGEFVYSAFLHNVAYVQVERYSRWQLFSGPYGMFALFCTAASFGAFALYGTTQRGNRRLRWLCRGTVLGGILCLGSAFLSTKGYAHYLLSSIPCAWMGMACGFCAVGRRASMGKAVPIAAAVLACFALVYFGPRRVADARALLAQYPGYDAQCQELVAVIPENERNDVLGYRVEPKWYTASGIVPARRLFFLQEVLAQVEPALMEELLQMFASNPPRWLATYLHAPSLPPPDPRMEQVLAERYEVIAQNDYNRLWRLKPQDIGR